MANEQNLIPFTKRSAREHSELSKKGQQASAKAKRRKKSMKQKMQMLLELPCLDNDKETLEAFGIDAEDMDNEMVLIVAQFLRGANGDSQAFDRIMIMLEKGVKYEELALKKKELNLKRKDKNVDNEVLKKLDEVLGGIKSEF